MRKRSIIIQRQPYIRNPQLQSRKDTSQADATGGKAASSLLRVLTSWFRMARSSKHVALTQISVPQNGIPLWRGSSRLLHL